MGDVLFGNALAGKFICMLSFICPFLFLSSILSSILHGLGMPVYPFLLNLLGSFVRIYFVYVLIPIYGLDAYLMGMLASQILTAGLLSCGNEGWFYSAKVDISYYTKTDFTIL